MNVERAAARIARYPAMNRSRPALPATSSFSMRAASPAATAARSSCTQPRQRLDQRQHLGAVVEQDVAPHRRAGRGDACRVAQAGGRQPPDPLDDVGRKLAQRRRQRVGRHVRQVAARARTRGRAARRHAHRLRAHRRPQPLDRRDGRLVAPRRRADHAALAFEQQRAGRVGADPLGARDRVAGDVGARPQLAAPPRRSPPP